MTESITQDTALFWDVENIQPSLFTIDDLLQYCENYGRTVVRRAFADWTYINRKVARNLIKSHFELYHLPHSSGFKNSSDIMMAVNSTNTLLLYPNLQNYVIVSNDKDFRSLIQILRMNGRKVILVCNPSKTSTSLIEMVDEYIDINKIADDDTDTDEVDDEPSQSKIKKGELLLDKLVEAVDYELRERKEKRVRHSYVLTRLRILYENLKSDMSESIKELKISKNKWFRDLLFLAEEKKLIVLENEGNVYLLSLPAMNKPTSTSSKQEQYFDYIADLAKKAPKGIHISNLANKCDAKFGKAFYKSLGFSSLKKALFDASDRDVISIHRDGKYYMIKPFKK